MGGRGPRTSSGRASVITESRIAAAAILADLRGGQLLDPAFERHAGPLDARDRRWVQELVWGTLRRRGWFDAVLSLRVRGGLVRLDGDVADLLRLGAYQLLNMNSVPPYAAIAQTVELAKQRHGIGASKLVNAVLRRVDRERDALEPVTPSDPVDALAVRGSHPRWLVARWVARFGLDATEQLLAANNTEPPTVLRPYGVVREQLEAMLEGAGATVHDAPLVHDSLILGAGVQLTELGAFKQGLFFVQDPAATLVTQYAAIAPGSVVADLCSAPGGKALELTRTARLVIAADRVPGRLERLLVSCGRLDVQNMVAYVGDAREPAVRGLDAVLLDVPCTGTGTLRRHPDARWRLKTSDLAVMSTLQRDILHAAADAVRPGGLLVYSTCSIEPEENDGPVDAFLAAHPDFVLEPPPEGAVPVAVLDHGRLRVLPHVHGVDGAFAARLRRAGPI
ncbi:MAG: 16S rRNA (cytosine(967)-C(5))-methyltransferase RsmB [Gemmatimonadaceae bacterium]|nr:16S rRNA (cytosine(967)-C(5))-methyltransferase RsmB [Gemmatimonadaceae bacterium]